MKCFLKWSRPCLLKEWNAADTANLFTQCVWRKKCSCFEHSHKMTSSAERFVWSGVQLRKEMNLKGLTGGYSNSVKNNIFENGLII